MLSFEASSHYKSFFDSSLVDLIKALDACDVIRVFPDDELDDFYVVVVF